MSLNNYKMETVEICKRKGWTGTSIEQVWLYLTEEVGELAGSIRREREQFKDGKKVKTESELGDVFSYLFQLSHMLGIDLDIMWEKQKSKMLKKRYYNSINKVSLNGHNKKMLNTTAKGNMCWANIEETGMQKPWNIHN
jgi:NTP pyrophosphatase (non-canonical NTP hydrolase)